jgi:TolB-like protein
MSQGQGFLHELRRRHVVRVAIAYAVAGWVLLQAASIVFPAFGAPEWVLKAVIALLALGFPVALILAWAFELTPHGIRRTEPADSPDVRMPEHENRVGHSLNVIVIAVLAVAVAFLLWRQFAGRAAPGESRPAAAAAAPGKSIAVLPFESLSEDKANAYFAAGMQDEILTRLAGIRDLKVISRTSTAQYASHPPDLKTVGAQLGVAAVLEGTVQKAGDAVHINLQLIDTASDGHLWAQVYDRDLKDIFAVERDVAENVADALKARLLPEERALVGGAATQDTIAHDLYLRGLVYFNRASDQFALTATEMPQAIALFEKARARDPGFALADAQLATAHMNMYWFAPDRTAARLTAAKSAAEQALARQPDLAEGHYALALYHYWGFRDYVQATQHLDIARKAQPNNAEFEVIAASIARRQAQWDRAIAGYERGAQLDPRASISRFLLGEIYLQLRRYDESERAQSRSAEIAADPGAALVRRAETLVYWKGDLAALRAALGALTPGSDAYAGYVSWFYRLEWWSRDYAAAARVAETNIADNWTEAGNLVLPRKLCLAQAYAAAGDAAKANALYAQVREQLQAQLESAPNSPDLHVALGLADAGLGLNDDAIAEGRKAVALMPTTLDAFTGPVYLGKFAQICVRVGANDTAIDALKQLFAMPAGHVVSPALLKLDPVWDPLRNDPRFIALLDAAKR